MWGGGDSRANQSVWVLGFRGEGFGVGGVELLHIACAFALLHFLIGFVTPGPLILPSTLRLPLRFPKYVPTPP